MNVASKEYFIFLPVVLITYHLLPARGQKYGFLSVASWIFYAWAAPQYLWVLIGLAVIDYFAAIRIADSENQKTRKRWLTLAVVSNLGLLGFFKYTAFMYDNVIVGGQLMGLEWQDRTWRILLPLGISFHTFQGISYVVDVYRGQLKAVRNFIDYSAFVSFFPQLAAGPIVRGTEFLPQMVEPPKLTGQQISDGLHLLILGLFKKLFIADQLDQLFVTPVFSDPQQFDPAVQRWATLAWAVQIYCDFSGYTDIALGTGKLFGFNLPPNFRLPYLATSITDFWRRWHLSLSTWLRDYLYFPLGGSRGSAFRTYMNLMIVFILCGLWHGAEWRWLIYGVYNGILMGLHRAYDRALTGIWWADTIRASYPWLVFAWAATFVQLLAGLILIRMDSWSGGLTMIAAMFGLSSGGEAGASTSSALWDSGIPPQVPALIALGLVGHLFALGQMIRGGEPVRLPEAVRAIISAIAIGLMITLGPGVGKSFIYIQF